MIPSLAMSRSAPLPAADTGFAALLGGFRTRLDAALGAYLEGCRRETEASAPEALALAESLESLLSCGGKRLRPALVAFSYLAAGGRDEREALELALSTELLHAYLLLHDDIMDRAETRRGKPAAHAAFRRHHEEAGWRGDSAHYGTSMAILVGDLAYAHALELFARVEPPERRRRQLRETFFTMCREVIDGQYLEMHMAFEDDPGPDVLARVLRLKSGLYSVERPLQLGLLLADIDALRFEALSNYGRALGEAFQLRDDLLGTFGESGAVGKPVGGDLREGKFTFLIHHALGRLPAAEGRRLRAALGNQDLGEAELAELAALIRGCGALAEVEAMIEARSEAARQALCGLELAEPGKAFLEGLVGYLGNRRI